MEVNYNEKIKTFQLLINNDSDDIALNYLERANWDESEAARLFEKENKTISENVAQPEKMINSNFSIEPNFFPKEQKKSKEKKYDINTFPSLPMVDPAVLNRGLKNSFFSFFQGFLSDSNYNSMFKHIKNTVKDFPSFYRELRIKGRIGILVVYDKSYLTILDAILKDIRNDELATQLFTESKVIFPVINTTDEGKFILSKVHITTYPTFLFCKKKLAREDYAIIGRIDNSFSISYIRETILKVAEISNYIDNPELNVENPSNEKNANYNNGTTKSNYTNINNSNSISVPKEVSKSEVREIDNIKNYDPSILFGTEFYNPQKMGQFDNYDFKQPNIYDPRQYDELGNFIPEKVDTSSQYQNYNRSSVSGLTNAEIIAQQKRDMEELERQENLKKLEEKKRKEKELEEERLRKEKEEQIKIESEMKKQILPPEPDKDDPNKATILFRYPDGNKTVERRFLKNEKIKLLYFFIESLGAEIYTEEDSTSFELIQTFPFKKYDNKEKTIEEEGLFPNAVLQIKEI